MIAVSAVLALVVVALSGCLIVSNRSLQGSNSALIRALIAKNGHELAAMTRAEKKVSPGTDSPGEGQPPLTRAELFARIADDIETVEGKAPLQPVGFDGT